MYTVFNRINCFKVTIVLNIIV